MEHACTSTNVCEKVVGGVCTVGLRRISKNLAMGLLVHKWWVGLIIFQQFLCGFHVFVSCWKKYMKKGVVMSLWCLCRTGSRMEYVNMTGVRWLVVLLSALLLFTSISLFFFSLSSLQDPVFFIFREMQFLIMKNQESGKQDLNYSEKNISTVVVFIFWKCCFVEEKSVQESTAVLSKQVCDFS